MRERWRTGETRKGERGFTLPEVLTTIAILGILLAIAIAIWFSVIEARRVDAAANQLASDLRLAHTRATNQLTDWRVVLVPEKADESSGPDYYLVKLQEPYDTGDSTPTAVETIPRTFPANVKVRDHDPSLKDPVADWMVSPSSPNQTRTLEFNSDGTMWSDGPSGSVKVTVDGDPERSITYLSATSRIKLD